MRILSPLTKQIQYILTQAFAYLFCGIFLLTFEHPVLPDWVLNWVYPTFGYIFLAIAFFLVVSPFKDLLTQWAIKLDYYLSGGLLFGVLLVVLFETYLGIKAQGFQLLSILLIIWGILLYVEVMWDKRIP